MYMCKYVYLYVYLYVYVYVNVYVWNLDLVTTVPADGLAPNGARPSAGIVLTTDIAYA